VQQNAPRFELRQQVDWLGMVAAIDSLPRNSSDGVSSFVGGPTAFDSSHPPLRVLLCTWRN
jgi:hypothetical protein